MKHPNEGYIKFHCHLSHTDEIIDRALYSEINDCRNLLFSKSLIGAYSNGVGYGNISVRRETSNEFYISGSATGAIDHLIPTHYVLVNKVDIATNTVFCLGCIEASSESMSHAVIYQSNRAINAVVHIHSQKIWETYLHKLPTTPENCAYGTPEIAEAIARLVRENPENRGIIITAGHQEGIITYGETVEEAATIALSYFTPK